MQLIDGLGHPEVGQLHLAGPGQEHVVGAHVAVDDAERLALDLGAMGVVQGAGDLLSDVGHQPVGQAVPEPLLEARRVGAVDQLQSLKGNAVEHTEVEHADDVPVVQVAQDAGLIDEGADRRLILGQRG